MESSIKPPTTDLPVSGDLENGYGDRPEDAARTVHPAARPRASATVALFGPESEHGHERGNTVLLAAAVVLHRVPTALAIWWLVVPRLGRRPAVVLLSIVGVATVLGFVLGLGELHLR